MTKCALPALHLHEARYFPAANTARSSNTGEHTRECEPQLPRGGGRVRETYVSALLFRHVPCVAGVKPHPTDYGPSWQLRGQRSTVAAARQKARPGSRGPSLRGAATFLPLFLFALFSFSLPCLPLVILLESAQGWFRSLHRPRVVQRQRRRSTAKGSDWVKMCSPPDEKERYVTRQSKEGCMVTSIVSNNLCMIYCKCCPVPAFYKQHTVFCDFSMVLHFDIRCDIFRGFLRICVKSIILLVERSAIHNLWQFHSC